MSTTAEDRIRAQFASQKKRLDYDVEGLPTLYLRLARQWQRPVQDVKRIVGTLHGCSDCGASIKAELCPNSDVPTMECPSHQNSKESECSTQRS